MSSFYRSPHHRRGKFGRIIPVKGHNVTRDAIQAPGSSSGKKQDLSQPSLSFGSSLPSSRSQTIPNTRCPKCHQKVFYYQNESGSRVYFDELGPPWPKHPCMSGDHWSSQAYQEGQLKFDFLELEIRDVRRALSGSLVVLSDYAKGFEEKLFMHISDPPGILENAESVFYLEGELSFFDSSKMAVVRVNATKLAGADEYVNLLVG